MKIKLTTAVFLFCTVIFASIPNNVISQNSKIKIKRDKILTVDEVFDLIMAQTDYKFFYEEGTFKNFPKVHIKKGALKTNKLLNKSLSQGNFDITLTSNNSILIKEKQKTTLENQQIQISGTISDKNGTPLLGANILEKGTTNGTQSDFDGNFSIDVTNENSILIISYIGFGIKEIALNGQTNISVSLEESVVGMDEVVVVGFGTQAVNNITGSVSILDQSEINETPNKSIAQVLQGRIPGLNVIRNSGAPNAEATLNLRGRGSIGSDTSPLIIIDGVEGSINEVNPLDIASVSVLKDASASSIYGAKAANGVVLITTKKGNNNGKTDITFSVSNGFQFARDLPKVLTAEEFAILQNEARINAGNTPFWTDVQIAELRNNNTYWIDEALSTGYRQQYNIALNGGNEKGRYSWSSDYLNHTGILYGNEYERLTTRLNLSYNINDWLEAGINGFVRYQENIDGVNINAASNYSPTITPKVGSPVGTGGPDPTHNTDAESQNVDPISAFDIEEGSRKAPSYLFQNNAYFKVRPVEGLEIETAVAYRLNLSYTKKYKPAYEYFDAIGDVLKNRLQSETTLVEEFKRNKFWSWTNTATYKRKFGYHNLGVVIGTNAQVTSSNKFKGTANNLPSEAVQQLDQGTDPSAVTGGSADIAISSQFGRINYGYKDKYLAEFSIRRDGSSKFGSNNKFAIFPSGSLGWVLSEEDFLSNTYWLDFLKLRISYGSLGNQSGLGNTEYISQYTINRSTIFNGTEQSGSGAINVGNPDIKWEESTIANIAIDTRLFNNKLNLTMEYFRKNTTDMLLPVRLPLSSGFNKGEGKFESVVRNTGEALNTGFEMSARYNGTIGNEFNFNLQFVGSYLKNEILALTPDIDFILGEGGETQIINMVGGAINGIHGYVFDGIYQNQAELDAMPKAGEGIGDVRFKDINSIPNADVDLNNNGIIEPNEVGIGGIGIPDGIIDPADRGFIGDPSPKYILGLNGGAQFKNFDFSFQIQGNLDQDFLSQHVENRTRFSFHLSKNTLNRANMRWTGEGSTNSFPRLRVGSSGPTSTYQLQDASYVSIREIEFGYSIADKILNKINVHSTRIYTNLANLYTFTNYYGFEGERTGSYGRKGIYPQSRTITFGITTKF